jgi:hypothetical protein
MKKYAIYFLWLPMLVASCTDVNELPTPAADTYHRVTASISSVSASPRVAIDGQKTAFTDKDPIGIGWQYGGSSYQYQYAYSADRKIFAAAEGDNNKDLWSNLIKAGSNKVDIYAWYGKLPASADGTSTMALPADDSSISVEGDQSAEANYLSSLYMAAHIKAAGTANNLDFEFKHLVSRIRLSVSFTDGGLKAEDIEGTVVKMSSLKVGATVGKDTNSDYQLTATDGTSDITMYTVRTDATAEGELPGLEANCLVPSQTLTTDNKISITLGNGKQYTCSLNKELALDAGKMVTLVVTVNVVEIEVAEPTITVIPNTEVSSFWEGRLIVANKDKTITVYEKNGYGSWGAPLYVYEKIEGVDYIKRVTGSYKVRTIDIYKNWAGIGITMDTGSVSQSTDSVYLCKKDANTGRWYVIQKDNAHCYALTLNEDYIVYGGYGNSKSCKIYPITSEGGLGKSTGTSTFDGFKLNIGKDDRGNNILCTGVTLYKLTTDTDGKVNQKSIGTVANYTRGYTDGKKIITQADGNNDIKIHKITYNDATGEPSGITGENIENAVKAGAGSPPVAISGDYAFAGSTSMLVLYYFYNDKWYRLGSTSSNANDYNQSFLAILKRYVPSEEINKATLLEGITLKFKGNHLTLVNTTSDKTTYFIENIDKIVKQYLADKNKPEGWWDPDTVLPAAFKQQR